MTGDGGEPQQPTATGPDGAAADQAEALRSDVAVRSLLRRYRSEGCVPLSEIQKVAGRLEGEVGTEAALIEVVERDGLDVSDDCSRTDAALTPIGGRTMAEHTTDGLGMFLQEIGRVPLLTPDEEVELAKRIEAGEQRAKDRMVRANLRLVVYWARRYQGLGLGLLDLIQEGVFGLVRAVEKYDWRKGYKFSTYATWWIRQSLQRAIQYRSREIRLPSEVGERGRRVESARTELQGTLGREPTDEELAEESGLTVAQVREVLDVAHVVTSVDAPVGPEGDAALGDLLPGDTGLEDSVLVSLEENDLRQGVEELPEPHRTIVRRRYGFEGDPMGRYRLGRELRMADRTVEKLEKEAIEMLSLRRELTALRPTA